MFATSWKKVDSDKDLGIALNKKLPSQSTFIKKKLTACWGSLKEIIFIWINTFSFFFISPCKTTYRIGKLCMESIQEGGH